MLSISNSPFPKSVQNIFFFNVSTNKSKEIGFHTSLPLLSRIFFFCNRPGRPQEMRLPIFPPGARGTPVSFPPRDSSDVPATAALTLGEQRGAHGDKNDEQRVGKHGAHLAPPSRRPHTLHGDKRSRAGERGTGKTLRGTEPPRGTLQL